MGVNVGTLSTALELQHDNFTGGLDLASGKLSAFTQEINGLAGAGSLAMGIFAGAVAAGTSAVVALGVRGSTVADVAEGFNQLTQNAGGATPVMNALRQATDGTISDFALMEASSKALSRGLRLSTDDFRVIGEEARILSDRVGGSTVEAYKSLMDAMSTGRTRGLMMQGMLIDVKGATEAYAESVGKTSKELSTSEKIFATRNAIIQASRADLEKLGSVELDFGDRVDFAKTAVQNFTDNLGVAISTSPVLAHMMDVVSGAVMGAFGENQVKAVEYLVGAVNKFAIFLTDVASTAISVGKYIVEAFFGIRAVVMGAAEGVLNLGNILLDVSLKAAKISQSLSFGPAKANADEIVHSLENMRSVSGAVEASFHDSKTEALASMSAWGKTFDNAQEPVAKLKGELVNLSKQQVDSSKIADGLNKAHQGVAESLNGVAEVAPEVTAQIERLTASFHKQIEASEKEAQTLDKVAPTYDGFKLLHAQLVVGQPIVTTTITQTALAQKATLDWANAHGAVLAPALKATGTALDQVDKKVSHFEQSLKGLGDTIVNAVTGGGDIGKSIGASLGKGIGDDLGESLSKHIGGKLGETLGGFAGPVGAALGSLLGSGVDKLFGSLFGDKNKEEVKKYNVEINKVHDSLMQQYGDMESLELVANRVGISFKENWGHQGKAGLEATNKLVEELEGRLKGIDEAQGRVISGLSAVVTGMTKPWREVGKAAEDASKKALDAYEAYQKALADPKTTDNQKQALHDTYEEAFQASVSLNDQLAGMAGSGKQQLADLGIIAVSSFGAAMAAGKSYAEALSLTAPALAQLGESYKMLGLEVEDVGLKHLILQGTILQANPELVGAIGGLATGMQGLAQLGMLNVDSFGAMERTGSAMYARLQGEVSALGGDSRDALMPMQGYLHEAEAQAKLLGIPLDANTQMLIDQSRELGIWKEAGKSANDLLLIGLNSLNSTLASLVSAIGSLSSGLNNMPRNVRTDVDVVTHYSSVDEGGGEPSRASGSPGTAFENWQAGKTARLHGRETITSMAQGTTLAGMVGDAINRAQESTPPPQSNEETTSLLRSIYAETRRGNETFAIEIRDAILQLA